MCTIREDIYVLYAKPFTYIRSALCVLYAKPFVYYTRSLLRIYAWPFAYYTLGGLRAIRSGIWDRHGGANACIGHWKRAGEFKQASKRVQAGEQASSSRRASEFKQASRRVEAGERSSSSRRAGERRGLRACAEMIQDFCTSK